MSARHKGMSKPKGLPLPSKLEHTTTNILQLVEAANACYDVLSSWRQQEHGNLKLCMYTPLISPLNSLRLKCLDVVTNSRDDPIASLIGPNAISTLSLIAAFDAKTLCTNTGQHLLMDLLSKVVAMILRYNKIQPEYLDIEKDEPTNLSIQVPVQGPVLSQSSTVIADAEHRQEQKNAEESYEIASRASNVIMATGLNNAIKSFKNGSLVAMTVSALWRSVFEHMLLLDMFDCIDLSGCEYPSETLFKAMKQVKDVSWTNSIPSSATPALLEEYMLSRFLPSVIDKVSIIGNFVKTITGSTSDTETPILLKLDAKDVKDIATLNARLVFPMLYPRSAPYRRSSRNSRKCDRSTFIGAEKIRLLISALPAVSCINNAITGQFAFEQYAQIPRSSALQLFLELAKFFVVQDIPAISSAIKSVSTCDPSRNLICNLLEAWDSTWPEYRHTAFNVVSLALSDLWRMARAYLPSLACIPKIGEDTSTSAPTDMDCYHIQCIDVFAAHPLNAVEFPTDAIQHVASKFNMITVETVSEQMNVVSLEDT